MGTAVDAALPFYAVADDAAVAMAAQGREHLDRTLEGVEGMGFAVHRDVEAFVVGVSAAFTGFHDGGAVRRSCATVLHGIGFAKEAA